MNFICSGCQTRLSIPDDLAGRAVQCPKCRHIADASLVLTLPRVAIPAVFEPPLPVASCPQCRGPLPDGAQDCRECGWSAAGVDEAAEPWAQGSDSGPGRCYLRFHEDRVDLEPAIAELLLELIETEKLDMHIMDESAPLPETLRRKDIVLTGEVINCDYGNRFIRYLVPLLALIGPGSCKLAVEAVVETFDGEKRLDAKSRLHMGLFGGSGDGLMKINVKAVSRAIARGAVRFTTKRSVLNIDAYGCVNWALGLGIASFIPFFGILLAVIGLCIGIPGLVIIQQRELPHGKVKGWIALALCFLGLLAQMVFIVLAAKH